MNLANFYLPLVKSSSLLIALTIASAFSSQISPLFTVMVTPFITVDDPECAETRINKSVLLVSFFSVFYLLFLFLPFLLLFFSHPCFTVRPHKITVFHCHHHINANYYCLTPSCFVFLSLFLHHGNSYAAS